jgi:hypothetical protein
VRDRRPLRLGTSSVNRDGLERTDILAVGTYRPHRPTVEIQVKTATDRGEPTNWLLGTKAQLLSESDHEWFVFVVLPRSRMLSWSPAIMYRPQRGSGGGTGSRIRRRRRGHAILR